MSTKAEHAAELHQRGCNCAQAVACTFCKEFDALYYASHYDDFIPAVNRCVESDYEIRIYRNRSLKGSRRNLASFCNLSIWKSQ